MTHMQNYDYYRSPAALFADEAGQCKVCLNNFHTRTRLMEHLSGRQGRQHQHAGSLCDIQYILGGYSVVNVNDMKDYRAATQSEMGVLKRQGKHSRYAPVAPVYRMPGPVVTDKYQGHLNKQWTRPQGIPV